MHKVFKYLSAQLDAETRAAIVRRTDGLMRVVRYEAEIQSNGYLAAANYGWTIEKIEILCILNSFYQIVLGPLAAASRCELKVGLITEIPVAYGEKVKVTGADAKRLRECHDQFALLTQHLGINYWVLQSGYAQDLLYKLGHPRGNHA